MTGRINQKKKERLKKAGLWSAFLKKRDDLKKAGHTPDKARSIAIKEISKLVGSEGYGKTRMRKSYKSLINKSASEKDIIRWVANNLSNPNPSPNNCPSLTAWLVLRECKKNKEFKNTFIFNIWTKLIPNNYGHTEKEDKTINSTVTTDLLDKIHEIKDKASTKDQI